ncbi:NAD(P)/FAD-dependent oxidoreductase [Halobaculum sp. MBLA0147]|uniref:NAD(P)/FAD-dependent oxidoreductase n=1 Tax=Halobaculum sp. MBLA0147 TaxID=3079934 RepID=UPI0035240F60
MSEEVAVAGAGLAGLVTAARLAEAGVDVRVYESRDTVGGRVRSRHRDGFVLDRGFQVLFTAYPAVQRELDLDALDLRSFSPGAVLCSTSEGTRSVLSDPLRDPGALVESAFNRQVSTADKLRTLLLRRDLTSRPESSFFAGDDQSIRSYLDDWGFAEGYVENFVAPFYGGITLDRSLATSKHVFEYTFRTLSRGRIAVPADGMGAIAEQLADRVRAAGVEIVRNEALAEIETERGGGAVRGSGPVAFRTTEARREAEALVVATDPKRAREVTGVELIPTTGKPSTTQYYALPTTEPLGTGEKILLHTDGESPNVVVPLSEVAPEYAPDDRELLCATFLGEDALDRDEAALAADTRDALTAWYPERSFDGLEPIHTDRLPFAQFAQPPGVFETLPAPTDPSGSVYLAGDYTEWSSIQGAMDSGARAASAVRSAEPVGE